MAAKTKVRMAPADLVRPARRPRGEGITAVVGEGAAIHAACQDLRRLRGKIKLDLDLEELRRDRS